VETISLPEKARSSVKIPSLHDLGKRKKTSTESTVKNVDALKEEAVSNDLLDQKLIASTLKEFAESLKEKGLNAEAAILLKGFEIAEGKILFKLNNILEEDLLEGIKQELTMKLREVSNVAISLMTSLDKEEGKKMIYTNKEKFEHLLNKKPILKAFKDRLGLDTDF
jgi:hypothetical protein